MSLTVAVIAPGAMGAALGQRLRTHGVRVLTSLEGRSEASAQRARDAGFKIVDNDLDLMAADLLLSVIPPADAVALAERLAPMLNKTDNPPIFADCNATSPATVEKVATIIAPTGAHFIDAGIIGPPPSVDGQTGPRLYAAGPNAHHLQARSNYGIAVETLDGPIGAASALKMCFAGINKGMTALTAIVVQAAARSPQRRWRDITRRARTQSAGSDQSDRQTHSRHAAQSLALASGNAQDCRFPRRQQPRWDQSSPPRLL